MLAFLQFLENARLFTLLLKPTDCTLNGFIIFDAYPCHVGCHPLPGRPINFDYEGPTLEPFSVKSREKSIKNSSLKRSLRPLFSLFFRSLPS